MCLQENVGFEESVENLNLIKEFCEKYLTDSKPFCFNFEDFLYSPITMKINKLAFIAELFFYFELEPNRNLISENHFELFQEYIKSRIFEISVIRLTSNAVKSRQTLIQFIHDLIFFITKTPIL